MLIMSRAAAPPITIATSIQRFSRGWVLGSASMWLDGSVCGKIEGPPLEPDREGDESVYDAESFCAMPETGLGIDGNITPV
jgi:hypothetical protein